MVKKFTYRGLTNEELDGLSLESMLKLFPARVRRSLTRGISENKRKLVDQIKTSKTEKNITIEGKFEGAAVIEPIKGFY